MLLILRLLILRLLVLLLLILLVGLRSLCARHGGAGLRIAGERDLR